MASSYTVQRSTTIAADPAAVYGFVVDFHRWTAWSPWEDLDPAPERSYEGSPSGPGAVYRWSGNRKAGRGRMEITEVSPGERVSVDVVFEKPFPSRSTSVFTLEPADGATSATWTMTGPTTLALRVMGLFTSMDAIVGPDFERGLARLKAAAESAN